MFEIYVVIDRQRSRTISLRLVTSADSPEFLECLWELHEICMLQIVAFSVQLMHFNRSLGPLGQIRRMVLTCCGIIVHLSMIIAGHTALGVSLQQHGILTVP